MGNPWDVRSQPSKGDSSFEPIFLQVGRALSAWETAESALAELFDVLVAAQPSNRAAFASFAAVKSSSARGELLAAAFARAMDQSDPAYDDTAAIIDQFGRYSARRNELAHGRVYNLGEHGFQLGPNNIMPHKWKDGVAKYQYASEDVAHYATRFEVLASAISALATALLARNIAARSTQSTRSRRQR